MYVCLKVCISRCIRMWDIPRCPTISSRRYFTERGSQAADGEYNQVATPFPARPHLDCVVPVGDTTGVLKEASKQMHAGGDRSMTSMASVSSSSP